MQKRFLQAGVPVVLGLGLMLPASAVPLTAAGHFSARRLNAERLSEPAGGFSYVPPTGWKIRTFPGAKYRISYTTPAQGFAPNINVVDEVAALSLKDYVRAGMSHMNLAYSHFRILSQAPFSTASGVHGVRLMADGTVGGRHVRQAFYIFPAAHSRKIIVTATWLASDGSKYAAAVDGAMKTFALK